MILDLQKDGAGLPQTPDELYARIEGLYGRVIRLTQNKQDSYANYEHTSLGRIQVVSKSRILPHQSTALQEYLVIQLEGLSEATAVDFELQNIWVLQEDSGEWLLIHAGPGRTESYLTHNGIGDTTPLKEIQP